MKKLILLAVLVLVSFGVANAQSYGLIHSASSWANSATVTIGKAIPATGVDTAYVTVTCADTLSADVKIAYYTSNSTTARLTSDSLGVVTIASTASKAAATVVAVPIARGYATFKVQLVFNSSGNATTCSAPYYVYAAVRKY